VRCFKRCHCLDGCPKKFENARFYFCSWRICWIIPSISVLDLDYAEDVLAETDMSDFVMNEHGFIEIQGTAEDKSFR
jgi:hypothetical protein